MMLQSKYLTEKDLSNFGFKKLGSNIKISSDARIYGPENITLGNNVRIDDFAILSAVTGSIEINNYVQICHNCHLSGTLGIKLMDFSSMAANVVVYSSSDDYSGSYLTNQIIPKKYTKTVGGPVVIGKHVIIGASSTILGGVKIGDGSSIGAMTLIIKDLGEWGVYTGIPAKRLRDRKKDLLKLENNFLSEKK